MTTARDALADLVKSLEPVPGVVYSLPRGDGAKEAGKRHYEALEQARRVLAEPPRDLLERLADLASQHALKIRLDIEPGGQWFADVRRKSGDGAGAMSDKAADALLYALELVIGNKVRP